MAHNNTSAAATSTSIQGIALYPIDPYIVIVIVLLVVGGFQWGAFLHTNSIAVDVLPGTKNRYSPFSEELPFSVYRLPSSILIACLRSGRGLAFAQSDPEGEPLNWCSRAGMLAASQFPLITVLGTKNNIVSLVTHISADKLNVVHRLAARACLIFTGIHVLGGENNFSFYKRASKESELFGIIAASTFVGLAVVSFRPVRERAYELFFYFHFVAVIVIMSATLLHINTYRNVSSSTQPNLLPEFTDLFVLVQRTSHTISGHLLSSGPPIV
ncbi:hypothetical protein JVT61DRAFT_13529 [Boletus reticuloceps]|uniref:Ferric oxidoreductase domain-containing protein n=1 Tax=Boletus reticuloceps TaxID=495285 RepID=A0A8I3A4F8_9AGAM|nr:hypothetical protein JVT61DRAFT_13529 [Boletus reticuloceps]